MSLEVWYEEEPCEPKYLQVYHGSLGRYAKKAGINWDALRRKIHDHHAQPVTKDGMFIVEMFFSGEVLDFFAGYLKSKGYTIKPDFHDREEGQCIVVGYDGILVHWSW